MIFLMLPSTLRQIRDKGNVLYDRINAQGHDECQDDIQAVSGIVEDIRDTVLDFQVGRDEVHAAVAPLKFGTL